jgi:hypothetical protein
LATWARRRWSITASFPSFLRSRTENKIAKPRGLQDLRSYVISGDKDEDFAGLARSGYGIPYDIGIESNRPLAQEMADVIAAALRGGSGATVKTVNLSPKMGRTDVIRAMTSAGTDQSLLLSVREWKTDTYGATGLAYDLELEALNAQGQVLAKPSTSGEEELGGSAWMFDPQSHNQEVAPPMGRGHAKSVNRETSEIRFDE